jgi:(heptosyl)LPS beta-1,4-glucosyltransferase
MSDVTAIIVIKNRPPYLFKTLASIDSFVSEIIIGTINVPISLINTLKKNKKIKFVTIDSSIPYADMIKEDLKKKATGKYILYMDPDEIFPKDAISVIEKKIKEFDCFYFPRKNIIFNKWIQHSRWWPDYQLRFFKKDYVIWPKIIHPVPVAKGLGFTFHSKEQFAIIHYNYNDLDEYFEKAFRYAKSEAQKYLKENKTLTLGDSLKKAMNEFISRYFACEGYKDGLHGFILSILQMFYYILIYCYYWEGKKYFNLDKEIVIKDINDFYNSGQKQVNYWVLDKDLVSDTNKFVIKLKNKIQRVFGN